MYSVVVVNCRQDKTAQYMGRPSPLGNPYPIGNGHTRNQVCDNYEAWFEERIAIQDPLVLAELKRLHRLGKQQGHLKLSCWCKPHRCHVDTIQRYLIENYDFLEELIYNENH